VFPQDYFGSGLKVQTWPDSSVCPELTPPPLSVTISPEPLVGWGCICAFCKGLKIFYHFHIVHFSWHCTSLSQQSFARSLSVKSKIWVNVLMLSWFILEFWFVVSVRWMKGWFVSPLFLTDGWLPLRHPWSRWMVLLRRVAPPWVSHPTPGRVAPLWLHGTYRVPWLPVPSVRARALQGPCGPSGSPHRLDYDGLVYHDSGWRPRRHSGESCPLGPHGVLWAPPASPQRHRYHLAPRSEWGQRGVDWARSHCWRPRASDPPCGLGAHGMLCPTRELRTSGGHNSGCSPAPPRGGVRRPGEGQEPRCQGHPEGQPRAPSEERLPRGACQGAEWRVDEDLSQPWLQDRRPRWHPYPTAAHSGWADRCLELCPPPRGWAARERWAVRGEQLEADLQHEVEHLQELIPPEPKEDPEEIEGMSGVDDD
jgi:hypothetical protein